ncbi:DUF6053 domain-containing protein [Lysobacter capsici]|uniref:DUF6053 domain-containing protein n=1 Tax=Lysobacter capsici TaxID=435897 RepID=UPI003D2F94FE
MGGASAPMLFVPIAAKLHRCWSNSVGAEAPPTKDLAASPADVSLNRETHHSR